MNLNIYITRRLRYHHSFSSFQFFHSVSSPFVSITVPHVPPLNIAHSRGEDYSIPNRHLLHTTEDGWSAVVPLYNSRKNAHIDRGSR